MAAQSAVILLCLWSWGSAAALAVEREGPPRTEAELRAFVEELQKGSGSLDFPPLVQVSFRTLRFCPWTSGEIEAMWPNIKDKREHPARTMIKLCQEISRRGEPATGVQVVVRDQLGQWRYSSMDKFRSDQEHYANSKRGPWVVDSFKNGELMDGDSFSPDTFAGGMGGYAGQFARAVENFLTGGVRHWPGTRVDSVSLRSSDWRVVFKEQDQTGAATLITLEGVISDKPPFLITRSKDTVDTIGSSQRTRAFVRFEGWRWDETLGQMVCKRVDFGEVPGRVLNSYRLDSIKQIEQADFDALLVPPSAANPTVRYGAFEWTAQKLVETKRRNSPNGSQATGDSSSRLPASGRLVAGWWILGALAATVAGFVWWKASALRR